MREQVEALMLEGLTVGETAARLGCSTRTVTRWRSVIRGTPFGRDTGSVPQWKLQRAELMVAEGAAQRDIALTLHIHQRTVARHFPGSAWSKTDAARHARLVRKMYDINPRNVLRDVS